MHAEFFKGHITPPVAVTADGAEPIEELPEAEVLPLEQRDVRYHLSRQRESVLRVSSGGVDVSQLTQEAGGGPFMLQRDSRELTT